MPEKPTIDIDHVADLARIHLSDEEKRIYLSQLGKVLEYFERLDELDVSNVEPTAHAAPVYNVWREDVPGPTMSPSAAVMNAPAKREGQVVMPRVVSE
ncbi:MAG: Asp-tRNA(Asn)/Glu-tRNA(Gln) amidotransferase subunit GatC [Opitutales bacterium]|jgi:aspartyl-tRNA(Asn)/glutamyl-tRNA(Gln) amidotransferase subunit C